MLQLAITSGGFVPAVLFLLWLLGGACFAPASPHAAPPLRPVRVTLVACFFSFYLRMSKIISNFARKIALTFFPVAVFPAERDKPSSAKLFQL